jgi:N-acetylglucosamine malate deacetylase 2
MGASFWPGLGLGESPAWAWTVIFAPHPDDEVIGASTLLGRLAKKVFVVYVTNGAPETTAEGYDRLAYVSVRRREAEAVLRSCAIPIDNALWLDVPDQQTSFRLRYLAETFRDFLEGHRPAFVVGPSYEGGHPDHDSTALALAVACSALRHPPTRLEMLSYHHRNQQFETDRFLTDPPGIRQQRVALDESARRRKQALFDLYTSQREVLKFFPIAHECFREAPDYDFLQPPGSDPLYYEFFEWGINGQGWREQARALLK